MHFRFYIVKRKGKNIWRPEIDTWRPKILVKSPHGDHVKHRHAMRARVIFLFGDHMTP